MPHARLISAGRPGAGEDSGRTPQLLAAPVRLQDLHLQRERGVQSYLRRAAASMATPLAERQHLVGTGGSPPCPARSALRTPAQQWVAYSWSTGDLWLRETCLS